MNDPDDDYGYDDSNERQRFEAEMQLLKEDKEAYEAFLDELIREGPEHLTETVETANG